MYLFLEPCFAKILAKTLFFITTHRCLQIVSLILSLNSKQARKKIPQSINLQIPPFILRHHHSQSYSCALKSPISIHNGQATSSIKVS
jgi:hypothetical protein